MTESRSTYTSSSGQSRPFPDTSEYDEHGIDQFGYTLQQKREMLERVAKRFAAEPESMAAILREFRKIEGIDEAKLIDRLAISTENYTRLQLCLVPREENFAEDTRKIAEYVGIDAAILATITREVQLLAALPPRTITGTEVGSKNERQIAFGNLRAMAARDRLESASYLREEGETYAKSALPTPLPAPAAAPVADSIDQNAESAADVDEDSSDDKPPVSSPDTPSHDE